MRESFRTAEAGDAENLSRLVNSAYRGDASRRGWTTEADLLGGQRTDPDTLRELLSEKNNTFLLLHRGADLIGCVFLQQKARSAFLGMLTVKPDLQAGGRGSRLLDRGGGLGVRELAFPVIEMTVIRQRSGTYRLVRAARLCQHAPNGTIPVWRREVRSSEAARSRICCLGEEPLISFVSCQQG